MHLLDERDCEDNISYPEFKKGDYLRKLEFMENDVFMKDGVFVLDNPEELYLLIDGDCMHSGKLEVENGVVCFVSKIFTREVKVEVGYVNEYSLINSTNTARHLCIYYCRSKGKAVQRNFVLQTLIT